MKKLIKMLNENFSNIQNHNAFLTANNEGMSITVILYDKMHYKSLHKKFKKLNKETRIAIINELKEQ